MNGNKQIISELIARLQEAGGGRGTAPLARGLEVHVVVRGTEVLLTVRRQTAKLKTASGGEGG